MLQARTALDISQLNLQQKLFVRSPTLGAQDQKHPGGGGADEVAATESMMGEQQQPKAIPGGGGFRVDDSMTLV